MPIAIRMRDQSTSCMLELLPSSWDLESLFDGLQQWLDSDADTLANSVDVGWIADLAFVPRPHAVGGGPVLSQEFLRQCIRYNLEIHLSEYPPFSPTDGPAIQDLSTSERVSLLYALKRARDGGT